MFFSYIFFELISEDLRFTFAAKIFNLLNNFMLRQQRWEVSRERWRHRCSYQSC